LKSVGILSLSPLAAALSSMSPTKRIRILTTEDVEEHATPTSCWVTRDGKVYDVTHFLSDHPGGDDLILKYAGKDVGEIMKDSTEHDHSDSAYNMLNDFLIGRLGADTKIVDDNWVASENFQPDETDVSTDYEKNEFLDLRRPLLSQFLYANFSKSYYLQQIHQPRHVVQSARLFGPAYLEVRSL
jgi:4-hydroxysphinganine ceramide fatty acyl 2-hydroxylase